MKPVLIIENSTNSLIKESASTKKDYILGGIFTEFGVKNRNERIYTAEKFLPALNELNERMSSLGVVFGEFDHPDVFDTSLSRASHILTKVGYVRERNSVEGEIKLLSTHWGKEARALVDDGCPVFVSSRAAGVTESDGSVLLKKLITYDIVADPGFASAKMNVKVLNESLGYNNVDKSNFRIYELSDESKTNELFNMNKNEFVTKKQLTDYSHYLVNEIASTKKEVKSALKKGDVNPKKLEQLLEYYETLNDTSEKIVKYLDYLSEKLQVVVNENKSLKNTTKKLVKHNDYLAENLEKSINYSEYIAENLEKNIAYSEYIAENLDRNISYSEYIAENLDRNISYSEYIAENLDKNIAYSEYIAENLDNNIAYSEYLAEHVEGNIAYSEYIAENLDENIAYSEYIAENLDKSIEYQGRIVEKLNNGKLFESTHEMFPTPDAMGFEELEEGEEYADEEEYGDDGDCMDCGKEEKKYVKAYENTGNAIDIDGDVDLRGFKGEKLPARFGKVTGNFDCSGGNLVTLDGAPREVGGDFNCSNNKLTSLDGAPEKVGGEMIIHGNLIEEKMQINKKDEDSELSQSINKLIEEAKKRKVSETTDLNFLKFLNKSQVDSFYALSDEDQESVKLHINEREYFTQKQVLSLIAEALSTKSESIDEKIIRLMPDSIKPIWENLNESSKKSVLSQARLYPEEVLRTESQIEHFWTTRNFKKNESSTRKLVSHEALIQEDKLSDEEANRILERFKNI
jgi:hypothetical protein